MLSKPVTVSSQVTAPNFSVSFECNFYPNRIFSVGALIAQLRKWHRQKWSGTLEVIASRQISWRIFFREGMLTWLAGGPDQTWRWRQYLFNFVPQLCSTSLSQIRVFASFYQEYLILAQLHQQGLITIPVAVKLQQTVLVERLFDLFQYLENHLSAFGCQPLPQKMQQLGFRGWPPDEVYPQAWTLWQQWEKAGLKEVFPDYFVTIARPPIIFNQAENAIQQLIDEYVDGTRTLRQISAHSEQDLLGLTQALMPLLDAGGLSLSLTPRLRKLKKLARGNENILTQEPKLDSRAEVGKTLATKLVKSGPLIAGIEDSTSFSRILNDTLTPAGFRFVSIPEPLTALATLLQTKPAVILLDLLMPQINGYQLCSHLRQVTSLKKTPIIFLTAQEGVINRVRAKMVGANGYLTKSINAEKLLETITQHLRTS